MEKHKNRFIWCNYLLCWTSVYSTVFGPAPLILCGSAAPHTTIYTHNRQICEQHSRESGSELQSNFLSMRGRAAVRHKYVWTAFPSSEAWNCKTECDSDVSDVISCRWYFTPTSPVPTCLPAQGHGRVCSYPDSVRSYRIRTLSAVILTVSLLLSYWNCNFY
jgi:hypothetical protein